MRGNTGRFVDEQTAGNYLGHSMRPPILKPGL